MRKRTDRAVSAAYGRSESPQELPEDEFSGRPLALDLERAGATSEESR